MIKPIIPIIAFIIPLFASNAYCENIDKISINQNFSPDNMFEQADDNLEKTTVITPPTCDNPIIYNKVIEKVKKFSQEILTLSIKNKRKKALILANINGFEEISAINFSPETDLKTANALIMLKINKKYQDNDFILCKQKGKYQKPLYLIMYPYMDNYMVHIINLDTYSDDYTKISFTYP